MKKKLKVYLQYPWKFPDSPYYKYLVDSPPEGIEFLNAEKERGVTTNKQAFWVSNFLKRNIRRWGNIFNLTIPNAHLSPEGNYDLIHCAHCLSKNDDRPWVCDIEMMSSFAIAGWNNKKGVKKVKDILLSENCKKIMPWTESIRKNILEVYPEAANKIEVVYPAVPAIKIPKRTKKEKLRVIFVARYFDIKGGLIALEVLENLRKTHNIEGVVVANVPHKLKKKYHKLDIYDLMPHTKLFNLMQESDIFLYPGSVDTFGFSLLEAMAFGLPVVTINTNLTASRSEIIEDGKTGIIFDVDEKLLLDSIGKVEEKVISKLVKNSSRLIRDSKLREKMSRNCVKIIKDGKFSIKTRNNKLKKIYDEAIK